jgi:hypothetical protein
MQPMSNHVQGGQTMNMMIKRIIALAFLLFSAAPCMAKGAGTESAAFLGLSGGARVVGMGEAYCAVSDDVDGVRYNPAGITQVERMELQVTHNEWLAGIQNEFAGLVVPVNRKTAVAGTVQYTHTGGIVKRDISGAATGGTFEYQGMMAAACVAHAVGPVSAGVSVKGVQESLDSSSDLAFAGDLGMMYTAEQFSAGVMVGNIGQGVRLGDERFSLPAVITAGFAYAPVHRLLLSMDVDQRLKSELTEVRVGGEYYLEEYLVLRAGYRSGRDTTAGPGLSAGLGFIYQGYKLDYAFLPLGDLGSAHRVSLGVAFGKQYHHKQ